MGRSTRVRPKSMSMYEETLPPSCLRLAQRISKSSFIHQFYLVGGTALSLQLGHRESIDLDFFSTQNFDPRQWKKEIDAIFTAGEITIREDYLKVDEGNHKSEFIYFAYPNHYPFEKWLGMNVLAAEDIALFKILAILGRNRKKDIIDLYFIDQEVISLEQVIRNFTQKYSPGDVNLLKQLELLFNDEEIEKSDMPKMLKPVDWTEAYKLVKDKLTRAIRKELFH